MVLLKPANTAKVLLSEYFHVYSILYSIKSKQTRCTKKFEFEKGSRDRNKSKETSSQFESVRNSYVASYNTPACNYLLNHVVKCMYK